jgi:hypothetical protein
VTFNGYRHQLEGARRFLTMTTRRITQGPRRGQALAFQSQRVSVFKLLAFAAPFWLLARFIRERDQ